MGMEQKIRNVLYALTLERIKDAAKQEFTGAFPVAKIKFSKAVRALMRGVDGDCSEIPAKDARRAQDLRSRELVTASSSGCLRRFTVRYSVHAGCGHEDWTCQAQRRSSFADAQWAQARG